MGSGGKGSNGTGITTYDYYGTVAAILRCGPIDTLRYVLIDGVVVWAGPIHRTDPGVGNPYTLTISDPKYLLTGGYVKLYWGDDTQTVADGALAGHPPYRGMAYLVFNKFLFGREKTTAPNIEIVADAAPRPPGTVIAATALDTYSQANAWAILAELLTSIHGLGLDAARLDGASFQAAHDYFAGGTAERQVMTYCSPLMTDQVEARQFIAELLSLCDGWLRLKADGTIEAGYYPMDPGDLSQYSILTANDLTEQPELNVDAWDNVPTGVVVSFSDFARWFYSNSVKVDDLRALQQAIEPRRETLQLEPFVVRDWQSRKLGAEWCKRKCQPQGSGSIKVRPERAVNPDGSPLRIGNRFQLDIDPEPGGAGLLQLCRVTERRRGPTGPVTLAFDLEVNQPATPYAPEWTPPNLPDQTVAAIPSALIFPMPFPLSDNGDSAIGVMAQRGDDTTVGAHVLFDVAGGAGTFTTLGTQAGFAVPCQLAADYLSTDTGAIRVTLLDTRDEHLALDQPGASGSQNDQLLLLVFKTDAGGYIDENADGTPKLEWFSIDSSAVVAGNTYDFTTLRARLGSQTADWNTNDYAWIIPQASIVTFTHGNFPDYVIGGDNLVFRLSPFSKSIEYNGVPANLKFHFPTAWQRAPTVSWTTPATESYTLAGTGNLIPVATIEDRDGNTVHIILYYTRDDTGVQTAVFNVFFPQSGSKTLADCFTLAGISSTLNFPGQVSVDTFYTLTVRVEDLAGNIVESRRSLVRLATGGGGGGFAAPVISGTTTFTTIAGVGLDVTAPANRIEYVVGAYGGAMPGTGHTVVVATHVSFSLNSSHRVWARAGDGTNWSGWVFKDFEKVSSL